MISDFVAHNFRHFNSAALADAADAYVRHLDAGGSMMITLAGAMSTAELGVSLAEMIRREKVHAICCTGANLEEDIFNLVAHDHYLRIPNYRELTAEQEESLLERKLNPRNRYLHSRRGGHAAHGGVRRQALGRGRRRG